MLRAGFIRAAAEAVRGSPLKEGFMTGKGWTYDDMADQTGGAAVCGTCRHEQRHSVLSPLPMPVLQSGLWTPDHGKFP